MGRRKLKENQVQHIIDYLISCEFVIEYSHEGLVILSDPLDDSDGLSLVVESREELAYEMQGYTEEEPKGGF